MGMREEEAEINMSEITVDYQGDGTSSSDLVEDCYRASSAEWTNEKHWLYLKSMEASFVNQLRSSMAQPRYKFDSSQFQMETCGDILKSEKSSSVFKYGSGSGARLSKSHSRAVKASHWIRRYRHRGKNQVLGVTISRGIEVNHDQEFESVFKPFLGLVRNSQQSVLCRKNALANNTEMMGQNFDGNDQVLESNTRRAKRKKTETTSNEDNDQVVPISRPKDMRTR